MISGMYWSRGKCAHNGDSLALEEVCTNRGEFALLVVSDGVGSLEHDEIISGYVVECMVRWFYESGMWSSLFFRRKMKKSLRRAILDCHLKLRQTASANNFKWAATCTLVCIQKGRFLCMQIGDSCCMKISGNKEKIICSRDRSEDGRLSSYIGSGNFCEPVFGFGRITGSDKLLVATDGFTDSFEKGEMSSMLSGSTTFTGERLEKRLVIIGEEADRRGATDNRSAICVMRRG